MSSPSPSPSGSESESEAEAPASSSSEAEAPGSPPPKVRKTRNTSSRASRGSRASSHRVSSDSESHSESEELNGTLRRKYSKLIASCQSWEEKEGFEGDISQVMEENIDKAQKLFEELKEVPTVRPATPQPSSSKQLPRPSPAYGTANGGPGDMYMAFMHTKLCSGMIRYKTDSIGSATSGFKVEEMLNSIKKLCVRETGESCSKVSARHLTVEAAAASKTLPLLVAVVGTFDRDAVPLQKEKKQRAPPVRKQFDEVVEQTQQEEVGTIERTRLKDAPETVAHHLNKILRHHTKAKGAPANLFEFILDPSSLSKSIEYLFYVAFLVHDGYAAITREADSTIKDLALQINPEKPLDRREQQQLQKTQVNRRNTRNQFILSFSPKMYKQLIEIAEGQSIIPTYKDFTEWGHDRQAQT